MIPRLTLLLLSLMISSQVYAKHIVGGEFELKHLSNYDYRLSLSVYFDEINGKDNQKESGVMVYVFEKGTNRQVRPFSLSLVEEGLLDYGNVGCTTSGLKTSRLLYSSQIYLDPAIFKHPEGYYIVWERCCRNSTTSNIASRPEAGTAIYMEFPPVVRNGVQFINSSPKLTSPPSEYACLDEMFYYNFGSTDADGDQLVYDMVTPLNGHRTANNGSAPTGSAPYPEIKWVAGYNKDNQIHGDPPINIDRNTGWLTVKPKYAGVFAFGVRCQEFRNGVKIGEVIRDFQLLVKACRFNSDPVVSIVKLGSPTPTTDGQVIRIAPTDSRCIKILYTDPDRNEPLTLDVNPINFTNNNVFSLSGTRSGVVNTPDGNNSTLEAILCIDQCYTSNGQPILLDLVVSDDGDDGCSLPRQTTRRISLVVEADQGHAPEISLSSGAGVFEVFKGDVISFDITGTDADNEQVTVSAAGRGFQLSSQNIRFQPGKGTGRATSSFNWEIDLEALKQTSYFIDFVVASTTSCGRTLTRTETIEVKPLQRDDFANNTIQSNQTICHGEAPATLTGSLPTGGSGTYEYTWEMSITNEHTGFTLAPGPDNRAQHYAPPALTKPAWFRRKVTSGWNDELTSNTVLITVRNLTGNNTITRAQAICANTAPNLLTGTEPTGGSNSYTYQWEYSTTGPSSGYKIITEAGKGKEKNYQPGVLNQTTWYRRVVMSLPCPSVVSNAVEIAVTPDISQNTIKGSQVVCEGSVPDKLTGPELTSSNDRFFYTWEYSTTSATAGFSPAPGHNTAADYAPSQLVQSSWFRRIVRTAAASCQSTSNTVLVSLEALPAVPQATDVTICLGEPATLQASAPAGVLFQWYDKPSGGKHLHQGSTYQTAPLHATTDFYVQAATRNGCASTSRTKVTVTVRPSTANAGEDVTIMEGQFVKLQATGGTSYSWSPAAGLFHTSVADPTVKPLKTTTYTVAVTSEFGCVYTDEVIVTVLPQVEPTNAITVNGDNINETWFIKHIELYPNCHVQIFTRWGNKIYESKGYREPWNGTHNGMPLPMASYYYIIDLGMNEKPLSGSITLIK